jgi:predicted Zn-dependent protease
VVTVLPKEKDHPVAGGTPETDAMVKQADELRKRGDFAGALNIVQQVLQKVPKHPQGLVMAGTLEAATGKLDAALGHLKAAVELMPANLFARKVYASALLEKHDTAQALEILGPVLTAKPFDSQGHTIAAQIAAGAADFDGAQRYLDDVFKAEPDFAPAHELAARIAFARQQPDQARPHLLVVLKSRPDDSEALVALANIDAAHGRMADAASLLEKARKAHPEAPDPLLASAQLALRQGHPDEAAGYVGKLEVLLPGNPLVLSLQGQLALAQGHPKDAIEPLTTALAKQPGPEILVQLHQALLANGQQGEADKRLKAWMDGHPEDQRMQLYAAETAARREDYAGAAALYRKILDKQPDNLLALNDLAQMLQAQKDPQALEVAEKAYKLKPDSPVTENTLGGILMAGGKQERGLALLRDAAGHAPQNPEVRFDYARALAVTGDKTKARGELEALIGLKRPFRNEAAAREMLKSLGGG